MTRTDEQQFLITANIVAAVHDYFPWRSVSTILKWPESRTIRTLRALSEQLLLTAAHPREEARLLPAGRLMAQQLIAMDKTQPATGK